MLAKRIIPCLDVTDGCVVKGKNFKALSYAGDPVSLARKYNEQGADELVFLDITATKEKRKAFAGVVKSVSRELFIPLTVGGGVGSVEDFEQLLKAGADKVAVNTAAIRNPALISEASEQFGSQCVVCAIDAKCVGESWRVFAEAGTMQTSLDALAWARQVEELGAGELLLTSMDADGTKLGFDLNLTRIVSARAGIPVIASGGAGTLESIAQALTAGKADAALAASIFHYGQYSVAQVKAFLEKKGVCVRR